MNLDLRRALGLLFGIAVLVVASFSGQGVKAQKTIKPVTLFAAASTTDAVNEIAEAYAAKTGGSIRPVVAASSTLTRQIAQGAPADLFLSANVAWMDHLADERMLVPESRIALLSNRLVLVAAMGSGLRWPLSGGRRGLRRR